MGWVVFALHYGSEVSGGFLWDGQYSHYIKAVKSVLGFCGMGWALFALHYSSEVSVGVLWDGMGSIRITV